MSYKNVQFRREVADTFAQMVRDELLDQQTAYALFCADLLNCQKVLIDVLDDNGDNKSYKVLLLRACPLVVYNHDIGSHSLSSGVDFNPSTIPIQLENMKSVTNTNLFTISEWCRTMYNIGREVAGDGICLDVSADSGGQREIWNKYKHRLFEWYRNAELPIYEVPMAPILEDRKPSMTKEELIEYQEALEPDEDLDDTPDDPDDPSLSEQMWGKLQGYYTAYIDNLGVFVKTGLQMDNIYADYIRDEDLIVCRVLLNAGEQEAQDTFDFVLQFIPGSGLFGSIGDAYEDRKRSWKLLVPRVYAFDRQDVVVLDYYGYKARCVSLGAKLFDPINGHPLNQRVYLPYQDWFNFLYPIFKTRSVALQWAPKSVLNRIQFEER